MLSSQSYDNFYNKPSSPLAALWQQYRYSIIIYFCVAVVLLIAYHLLSDGDFSFLMTLGSVLTTAAFALLTYKAYTTRHVAGISLKTLQAFAIVYAARLSSILFYEGYLPFDRSGDWFYQVCESLALAQVLALLAAVAFLYKNTYSAANDAFGSWVPAVLSPKLGLLWIAGPTLVAAILLHPSLNGNWLTDTLWTWALYLEAFAVLPQLTLFQRSTSKRQQVEPFTANFVFFLAVARVLQLIFWYFSYQELNDKYAQHWGSRYPGQLVVLSQVVNILVMGDYVYNYVMSARRRDASTVLNV